MTANLTANTATGEGSDTFVQVENLVGSDFEDRLIGSDGPNVLTGRAGNDGLQGEPTADIESGGASDDFFRQGASADGADQSKVIRDRHRFYGARTVTLT